MKFNKLGVKLTIYETQRPQIEGSHVGTSRPPSLSLSLSLSLSPFVSLSSSLSSSFHLPPSTVTRSCLNAHTNRLELEGAKMASPSSSVARTLVVGRCGRGQARVKRRIFTASKGRPSIIFKGGSRCLLALLIPLIKMVPSVFNKSAMIISTYSCVIITLQLDLSQTKPYFEVMILNLYS